MTEITPLTLIDITAVGEVCGPEGCAPLDAADVVVDAPGSVSSATVSSANTASFGVAGMTCSHCVASVTRELSALPGVDAVAVQLLAGGISTVTIGSADPIPAETVRAAVEEAGYVIAE
jgi:copper chaperone CopZ